MAPEFEKVACGSYAANLFVGLLDYCSDRCVATVSWKGLAVDREDSVSASGIDKSGSGATLAGYGPLPAVARTSLDFRCRNI